MMSDNGAANRSNALDEAVFPPKNPKNKNFTKVKTASTMSCIVLLGKDFG